MPTDKKAADTAPPAKGDAAPPAPPASQAAEADSRLPRILRITLGILLAIFLYHVLADRFHLSGQIRTGNLDLGPQQPGSHQPQHVGPAGDHVPDVGMDRGGPHAHQDLVGARHRLVDLPKLEHLVGRTVPDLDDGFHGLLLETFWFLP